MPKLRSLSGREVRAIMERQGWTFARQTGSHMMMQKSGITVPVPDHRELATGTLSSIIRQSGLARSLFETS
jgi:predicted RNA binding protein YcfA (HicA-like mRNA interferase family)